jgi:hypothetical protein
MRQQITISSGWEIKDINPNQVEVFWRDNTLIDTTQIKQKPVFWKFTISATGDYTMNIGFIPSLLYIDAFEDWHSPFSHWILKADYNVCRYVDSGGNNAEASLNTIIYLSHAGITSATIKSFGKKVIINCNSYNHSSKVHWEAFP